MERVSERKINGEEEVAEEAGAGLEIRQRRRGKDVNGAPAEMVEERRSAYLATGQGNFEFGNGAPAEMEEERRSVYLATGQGIEFEDITAGVSVDNSTNGISDVAIEALNNFENVQVEKEEELDNSVKGESTICKNIPNEEKYTICLGMFNTAYFPSSNSEKINGNGIKGTENGTEEYKQSGKNKGNGVVQHEGEIEEIEQYERGKFRKIEVEEFDVERVLEEQETHDLFCPNCNSCITKRVILRKRKRTVRSNKHDLPPEKLQNVHGGIVTPEEPPVIVHEDKEVFRCLSCFSFFISTDGGFNIFRIFGKNKGSQSLQNSVQVPERTRNWIDFFFRPETSKTKGNEAGHDVSKPIDKVKPASPIEEGTQPGEIIHDSEPRAADETLIDVDEQQVVEPARNKEWDVLKSIVYGGLVESITSLGVVSSAAGATASTLNVIALGLANLVGGLPVIINDISELRSTPFEAISQSEERADRYWQVFGRRVNFRRHFIISILSYIIFGLLPPVVYGFSFRESDNKEYKLIAVAASSLLCIALLAIGKAHVKPEKDYIKCVAYYISLAVPASGLSYVAGVFTDKLLAELGIFDQGSSTPPSPPSSLGFRGIGSGSGLSTTWASR